MPDGGLREDREMSEITWTEEELAEFDELVDMVSDRHQATRIAGRLDMGKFVNEHGKAKCDAMWAHLQKRDGK
jgi:hypothetical protein